ncbi:MAG: nucleotidyltransferase domain-containing protein, partial [Candidatus Ratteibacteria bacterium]
MEEKIRNKVEKFLKIIEDIFGKRLLSCILYGSAVKGNYKEGISDINLIIIIDKFEAKDLDEIKRRVSKFAWKNLIKPYFFSEWFLLSSADVFPVEWMDIKENHIVLYGEDLTEKINVENKNLRIELERKLKQLFLDFQQGIIFEKNKHIVLEETIKS